jgi:adenine-specific DNA-methyltransferase
VSIESILSASPQYFGNKQKLLTFIFTPLAQIIPSSEWSTLTFFDAFRGSGVVSQYTKLKNFGQIETNDISPRSQIVSTALIENNHTRIKPYQLVDFLNLTVESPGYIEAKYANQVFSLRHARRLDQLRAFISTLQDPQSKALFQVLLWHLTSRYVAYGTSIGTSNRACAQVLDSENYHLLSSKRLQDGSFERLLKPTLHDLKSLVKRINQGVFPASSIITSYQSDVMALLPTITADIGYFDPPYANTVGYETSNRVLDDVLFGPNVEPLSVSPFTRSTQSLTDMFDVARHIPVWLLSYNDRVCSLEKLIQQVKQVEPSRTVKGYAKRYRHMPHVSKRENHEFLVIAYK